MRDKTDHMHEPKAKELRTAEPDVLTLLLHAQERVTTPEDVMKGCHDMLAGIRDDRTVVC